jgi:hypothetical protein
VPVNQWLGEKLDPLIPDKIIELWRKSHIVIANLVAKIGVVNA